MHMVPVHQDIGYAIVFVIYAVGPYVITTSYAIVFVEIKMYIIATFVRKVCTIDILHIMVMWWRVWRFTNGYGGYINQVT